MVSTNDLDIARKAHFDTTTQPIALTEERTGLVRAVNAAFLSLVALPQAEVIGHSVVELGLWSDAGQRNSFLNCLAIEGHLSRYPLVASPRFRDTILHVSADPVLQDETGLILLRFDHQASAVVPRSCCAQATSSALTEKETLLREIHHRVKNNLQIIASLLNLQTDRTEDPVAIQVLEEAADRVQSMALVHTMLYGSANLSSIDAAAYLRTLAIQILRGVSAESYGVDLRFRLESLQLDSDHAVPVGLIVNELVTNALKYGVGIPGPGVIEVSLSRTETGAEIAVSDSGGRLPLDFHPEKVETLGMQLVLNLTRQLKGRMDFSVGEETRFRIHFPL